MELRPNAKINLGLYITSKREDGYHEIKSVFIPIPWEDRLQIQPSDHFSFHSTGLNIKGDSADNLCVKAYHLLKEDFDIPPVSIELEKLIPMGAGLGGGSADAAFTLKGLNSLFQLGLNGEQLESYAARLGSDCVFFINNKPAYVSGRGEIIEPIEDFKLSSTIVVVKPEVFISTQEAYSNVKAKEISFDLLEKLKMPFEQWKSSIKNDFEFSLFSKYPLLEEIKQTLYKEGAFYASMSGSGSCIYGLFEKPPQLTGYFNQFMVSVEELKFI